MEENESSGASLEHQVTKARLDRKVQLMSQIVFAYLIEICLIFAYVVLTVTVRHEFRDYKCYGAVWMSILAYFLFYVRTGFNFVLEF